MTEKKQISQSGTDFAAFKDIFSTVFSLSLFLALWLWKKLLLFFFFFFFDTGLLSLFAQVSKVVGLQPSAKAGAGGKHDRTSKAIPKQMVVSSEQWSFSPLCNFTVWAWENFLQTSWWSLYSQVIGYSNITLHILSIVMILTPTLLLTDYRT